jgi:feruloyl esterase
VQVHPHVLSALRRASLPITVTALWVAALANVGHAATYANLAVVKPLTACAELTNTDLGAIADTPGVVQSAELMETPKGMYCKVTARPERLWLCRHLHAGIERLIFRGRQ